MFDRFLGGIFEKYDSAVFRARERKKCAGERPFQVPLFPILVIPN